MTEMNIPLHPSNILPQAKLDLPPPADKLGNRLACHLSNSFTIPRQRVFV